MDQSASGSRRPDRARTGVTKDVGCSGCDGWHLGVICGHGRVPFSERLRQSAVEGLGAGLQEQVGAGLGPLHLLLLGEALADHEVDGGLGEGGRDRLRIAPALAVVRDRGGVVVDVGDQACRRFGEPRAGRGSRWSGRRHPRQVPGRGSGPRRCRHARAAT